VLYLNGARKANPAEVWGGAHEKGTSQDITFSFFFSFSFFIPFPFSFATT
jgi:hypothetical protein